MKKSTVKTAYLPLAGSNRMFPVGKRQRRKYVVTVGRARKIEQTPEVVVNGQQENPQLETRGEPMIEFGPVQVGGDGQIVEPVKPPEPEPVPNVQEPTAAAKPKRGRRMRRADRSHR